MTKPKHAESPDEPFDADDLALEASILRDSFAHFVPRFWALTAQGATPYVRNRAVDEVIAVLQRVADGELHRVLIALPSGVGKSTLLALYKGWRLARDAGHRSIHMTHAEGLAKTESLRVRRLVESDEYRRLFPHVVLREDEQEMKAWATTHGGRYYAVGVDSALLGRRAGEAVLDDPLDAGERFSRAARERLWTWFEESLATRLDGERSPIIVVHQRLCADDLIGRLAEHRDADGRPVWHLLELPAEDEHGELLAPTILTRGKLDELKARNPRVYACMFLQRPSADDGATIARTAWRFHAPAGANMRAPRPSGCAPFEDAPTAITPERFDRIVISVDPTFGGTKSTNDYAAIHVWGAAGPGRYLLARWKKKAKQLEQRAEIKRMRAAYPNARILIEKSAGGDGAVEELSAEGVTNIELVPATASKAARLENVEPTIALGFVHLPLGMPDLAGFVEELAGATRHDDDQDAASQGLHWLNVNAPTSARERWRGNAAVTAGLAAYVAARDLGYVRVPVPPKKTEAQLERERAEQIEGDRAFRAKQAARMADLDARDRAGEKLDYGDRYLLRKWRAIRSQQAKEQAT